MKPVRSHSPEKGSTDVKERFLYFGHFRSWPDAADRRHRIGEEQMQPRPNARTARLAAIFTAVLFALSQNVMVANSAAPRLRRAGSI
jgi:hypothetical protein